MYEALKVFVLHTEYGASSHANVKRHYRTYTKMCTFAQKYFDPAEIPAMLEEMLPYFTMSCTDNAFVVTGLINLFLPTSPPPEDDPELLPQHYFPTFFHLWSLVNRSKFMDMHFVDLFSRCARDMLMCSHVPFSEYGIFTEEQSQLIFHSALRIFEVPVGQSVTAYSSSLEGHALVAGCLDRDTKKHSASQHIARWIVMSLSPACATAETSVLTSLEDLMNGLETFFHPSNSGSWTKPLSQFISSLCDFFVLRWNRELNGELDTPPERRLNNEIRARFVKCLREVVFMGIFAKSGTAISHSLFALQYLSSLEPNLILPGILQRIYPALQNSVEVHRTNSALRALQVLTKTLANQFGYRCHITSLLGLALPGIDPNDLQKTIYTLLFIQAVSYNVPLHNLGKGPDGEDLGNSWALTFITNEVQRLDEVGPNVEINYAEELSVEDEEKYLRSSTVDMNEFVVSLLERVFTLLKNLPDASRVRSGSPEENVINTLPATFTPFLASLSPEIFDVALNKMADFVMSNTINQARDAVAYFCNALVRVNPEKALARLIPEIITCIRTEIIDIGAASTRTIGSEVLPRDQALVWHISMLSMCVVHVGESIMKYEKQLFDIAHFMQEKCQGIPTLHISNYVHHLLLNLTSTYTLDFTILEPSELSRPVSVKDWGRYTLPEELTVTWHSPSALEIEFAIRLFKDQAKRATDAIQSLISDAPPVPRDGTGKAWSDEICRNLVLLRFILSGASVLWDPQYWKIRLEQSDQMESVMTLQPPKAAYQNGSSGATTTEPSIISVGSVISLDTSEATSSDEEEPALDDREEDIKPTFRYESGYPLERGGKDYMEIHRLRDTIGEVLHETHEFLVSSQEDDVQCFDALYNAYRSWFVDVGIERSAHILDRVNRLLKADTDLYKFSGLRKDYPRPLLVRRANLYHIQRLRYDATPRPMNELEKRLLLDLSDSSVSAYTQIRRTAQGASEYALKSVIGARPLIIPKLLDALEDAVQKQDFARIKGGLFSLLYSSLGKPLRRDWRLAPRLIKTFIDITTVDKPSVQKIASSATWVVLEWGRPLEPMVIFDEELVAALKPFINAANLADATALISEKKKKTQSRLKKIEKVKFRLSEELVELARTSHWKKAARTAAVLVNLGMRFDHIASEAMINLVITGSTDTHPTLRGIYQSTLVGIFALVDARASCNHDYKRFLLMDEHWPDKMDVDVMAKEDPTWTDKFLESFSNPNAKYYVDYDYPGWLVWKKKLPAFAADSATSKAIEYDATEKRVREQVGALVDRKWFKSFFDYLKQEPRDSSADRYRMSNSLMLSSLFDIVFDGLAKATFEDIRELLKEVLGDGSDKHQHRATSEIVGGLLALAFELKPEIREQVWEFVFPIILGIFQDGLTPENSGYWNSFLRTLFANRDPRRVWPLLDWLASYRLDLTSHAAFKESSKISLLNIAISEIGWHFQLDKGIVDDFVAHLDHPYKAVREAMGVTLAYMNRTRHHESYADLQSLMKAQKEASSIGTRPYQPTEEFSEMITEILARLEKWRKEYTPAEQSTSPYLSGSKTVLLWFDYSLSSYESGQFIKFFPDTLTELLLHMMDVKEDPELQALAYHIFRQLPNVPHRVGEEEASVRSLMRIGREARSWHQRMRALIPIQVIYFRRLFLMRRQLQLELVDCVAAMLEDAQLEVRQAAQATLSGMVKCSPLAFRDAKVLELRARFTRMLRENTLPKRTDFKERAGTPTTEQAKVAVKRHAAVLGLGALITAFPYTSPPPEWLPEILTTLALKAAGDPGVTGKGAKQILADFKKSRQDTWHVDVKVRLRDLMGDGCANNCRRLNRRSWRIWRVSCGRATLHRRWRLVGPHCMSRALFFGDAHGRFGSVRVVGRSWSVAHRA